MDDKTILFEEMMHSNVEEDSDSDKNSNSGEDEDSYESDEDEGSKGGIWERTTYERNRN